MDLPPICADFLHDLLHYPCTYFTKNSHFLQCLQALYGCSANPTYVPTDTDLESGFKHSRLYNLQTKGILYLIESGIRPANSATMLLGFDGYSLEHLLPKKWRNNWPACETVELARERDSMLLTLGNLAIITQSLNASIRDADWSTKKAGKKNKPGLNLCAAGLSTLFEALSKEEWNEAEIDARAHWLYEKAAKLWKIQ